ncbi:MAG: hypothetical protein PHW74_08865 [Desulfobacca sp.]|nr:hypothetical protein [Desulfobacca sp.]
MIHRPLHIFKIFLLIGILLVGAGALASPPVQAGQEDAALFQEALARFGQWLDHSQYGPVWRPQQVAQNWQPYTNGRWVPTQEGYVFETDEPWGWATYHYGNWANTGDYGWVWVPGRTWYPHTVNWRTNDQYVGWNPVAPPDTAALGEYASEYYSPGNYPTALEMGPNSAYGYQTSPLSWIFTQASNFLLGWGQSYSPAYSYASAGVLASPQYIPTIYERTVYVNNYVTPSYAPRACYNWGPPVKYINKVTNINIERDHCYRNIRLAHLRNALPPAHLESRHPGWREVRPAWLANHRFTVRPVSHARMRPGGLNRPDALAAPASLSRSRGEPGRREGRTSTLANRDQRSPSPWVTASRPHPPIGDERGPAPKAIENRRVPRPGRDNGTRVWQRPSSSRPTVPPTPSTKADNPRSPWINKPGQPGISPRGRMPEQHRSYSHHRPGSRPAEAVQGKFSRDPRLRPPQAPPPARRLAEPRPRQKQRVQHDRRPRQDQARFQQEQHLRRQQQVEMAKQQQMRLRQEQQQQQMRQQQHRRAEMPRQQQIMPARQLAAPTPPSPAPQPRPRQKKPDDRRQP